jgi:hypothetical protein
VKSPRQEGGHLTSGDEVGGAEPVVGGRVARLGYPGGAEPVDRKLEHRTVVIDEQVPTTVIGEPERADQEGGHLLTTHQALAAVSVVRRGIAALGHSCSLDPVSGVLVEERVIVYEEVASTVVGIVEGAGQEHGHLTAGDEVTGTEPVVRRRIASLRDAFGRDGLDGTFEDVPVVVYEGPAGWKRRESNCCRAPAGWNRGESNRCG